MRFRCSLLLALFLLFSGERSAHGQDRVETVDGVVTGTIRTVRVTRADGVAVDLEGAELLSVRLAADRGILDATSLEANLRFAVERARSLRPRRPVVGVYAGRGVFYPSARAVARRLEEAKIAFRLLFESEVRPAILKPLEVVIVPGGWAPSIATGLRNEGLDALRAFVSRGGHYLGICAGAFLACESVDWEGKRYPYRLRIAPGVAVGPVAGLAPWPRAGPVALKNRPGRARAVYAGGCHLRVTGAEVLDRYPTGQASAVLFRGRKGSGRVLLTGAHVEFREKVDRQLLDWFGWAKGVEPGSAPLFLEYLKRLRK